MVRFQLKQLNAANWEDAASLASTVEERCLSCTSPAMTIPLGLPVSPGQMSSRSSLFDHPPTPARQPSGRSSVKATSQDADRQRRPHHLDAGPTTHPLVPGTASLHVRQQPRVRAQRDDETDLEYFKALYRRCIAHGAVSGAEFDVEIRAALAAVGGRRGGLGNPAGEATCRAATRTPPSLGEDYGDLRVRYEAISDAGSEAALSRRAESCRSVCSWGRGGVGGSECAGEVSEGVLVRRGTMQTATDELALSGVLARRSTMWTAVDDLAGPGVTPLRVELLRLEGTSQTQTQTPMEESFLESPAETCPLGAPTPKKCARLTAQALQTLDAPSLTAPLAVLVDDWRRSVGPADAGDIDIDIDTAALARRAMAAGIVPLMPDLLLTPTTPELITPIASFAHPTSPPIAPQRRDGPRPLRLDGGGDTEVAPGAAAVPIALDEMIARFHTATGPTAVCDVYGMPRAEYEAIVGDFVLQDVEEVGALTWEAWRRLATGALRCARDDADAVDLLRRVDTDCSGSVDLHELLCAVQLVRAGRAVVAAAAAVAEPSPRDIKALVRGIHGSSRKFPPKIITTTTVVLPAAARVRGLRRSLPKLVKLLRA